MMSMPFASLVITATLAWMGTQALAANNVNVEVIGPSRCQPLGALRFQACRINVAAVGTTASSQFIPYLSRFRAAVGPFCGQNVPLRLMVKKAGQEVATFEFLAGQEKVIRAPQNTALESISIESTGPQWTNATFDNRCRITVQSVVDEADIIPAVIAGWRTRRATMAEEQSTLRDDLGSTSDLLSLWPASKLAHGAITALDLTVQNAVVIALAQTSDATLSLLDRVAKGDIGTANISIEAQVAAGELHGLLSRIRIGSTTENGTLRALLGPEAVEWLKELAGYGTPAEYTRAQTMASQLGERIGTLQQGLNELDALLLENGG